MIPVKQTKRGGPDAPWQERGDCFDACLASILEVPIEQVRVSHDPDIHWWDEVQRVLAKHGYQAVEFGGAVPAGYWMASVPSKNLGHYEDGSPVLHVIVCKGEEVVHDPCLGDTYQPGSIDGLEITRGYALTPLEIHSLAVTASRKQASE